MYCYFQLKESIPPTHNIPIPTPDPIPLLGDTNGLGDTSRLKDIVFVLKYVGLDLAEQLQSACERSLDKVLRRNLEQISSKLVRVQSNSDQAVDASFTKPSRESGASFNGNLNEASKYI